MVNTPEPPVTPDPPGSRTDCVVGGAFPAAQPARASPSNTRAYLMIVVTVFASEELAISKSVFCPHEDHSALRTNAGALEAAGNLAGAHVDFNRGHLFGVEIDQVAKRGRRTIDHHVGGADPAL